MSKRLFILIIASCLTFLGEFSPRIQALESKDIVLHYNFKKRSEKAIDVSGNRNDGIIYGAKWLKQGDRYALSFDGNDDFVDVKTSKSIDSIQKSGTIIFWYRLPDLEIFPGIMSVKPSGTKTTDMPLSVFVRDDNKVFAYISDQKTYNCVASDSIKRDKWAHFAVTWDGSRIKGYSNGKLTTDFPCSFGPAVAGRPLWIGKDIYRSSPFLTGCIGEVVVCKSPLKQADIVKHYENGIKNFSTPPQEPPKSGPILSYNLNEGSGTVARDKSGNGLNGKIIGAKYVRKGRGYALNFNGNSCIQVKADKLLNDLGKPGKSYSIEFRFKSAGRAEQSMTEKWPTSIVSYPWAIRGPYPDGSINFIAYDAKTGNTAGASYTHPATRDNKWHHLTAVRDMESGYVFLYIDGVLGRQGSDTLTRTDLSNKGQVCLGARNYSKNVSLGFVGQMDDIKIYDRALSKEEIKKNCGLKNPPMHSDIQSSNAVVKYKSINPVISIKKGDMTVKIDRMGAIQVDRGTDSYVIKSCFSYPGDKNKIGWNGFPKGFDQPGYPVVRFQKGKETYWRPKVRKVSKNTFKITAYGKNYRIERTIKILDGKIDFKDKLKNLRKVPTGVIVRHGITANNDFLERYNGGQEIAANPTVFLKGRKRSAAMVMNDKFSRRRIRPAFGSSLNHSGVQLQRFALDALKTYTFSWSVYVMKEGRLSYFDFINLLRKDWKANFTIDGSFDFAYLLPEGSDIKFFVMGGRKEFYLSEIQKNPAEFQKYFRWRGTKFLSMAPWLYHDPGAIDHSVTKEEFCEMMKRFIPLMHKVIPEVKILASIETDWVSFRREKIKDGHKIPIPDRTKKSGPSLVVDVSPEISKIIENSLPSWKDSFVYDQQGRMKIITYYRGGKAVEQPPVCVFPEVGNARYKHMFDHIKLCIDELGFDGVYCDEFVVGQIGARRTYSQWDGISASIDSHTGEISGKYKDCSIAGMQARINFMKYVLSKGKIFVANRQSTTCEEQPIPAFRFTETGTVVNTVAKKWKVGTKPPVINYLNWTLLNTPIGLGGIDDALGNETQRLMKTAIIYLRHGMVFYPYVMQEPVMNKDTMNAFDIIKNMYPITPVELGEGFIVGKERTITAVSLNRLWTGKSKPDLMIFDINGKRVETKGRCMITSKDGKWQVDLKLKDWAEVAIIK